MLKALQYLSKPLHVDTRKELAAKIEKLVAHYENIVAVKEEHENESENIIADILHEAINLRSMFTFPLSYPN